MKQGKVLSGPFRGVCYGKKAVGSVLAPKIFGTYEKELWPIWDEIIKTEPSSIVDVGAAEGYYAVGFSVRMRNCKVIAFETTAEGRQQIRNNARKNRCLTNMKILGKCTAKSLKEAVLRYAPKFMIMDVEGAEKNLLTDPSIKLLKKTNLIVELHPWIVKNIKTFLWRKFKKTHQLSSIRTKPRSYFDIPKTKPLDWIFARWWKELVDERRPEPMEWLVIRPRRKL